MTILRASLAIIFVLLTVFISIMNWVWFLTSKSNEKKGIDKYYSTVPAISIILAIVLAYPLFPFSKKWWILILPIMDIGTWHLIVGLPWAIANGALKKEPPESIGQEKE